jgi:hypothetical protein
MERMRPFARLQLVLDPHRAGIAWTTKFSTAAGIEPDNNAVIIAPLKQMIVIALISWLPFSGARALNISLSKNLFWRDALPFDRGMRAEPALFRQIEVFNSDGTLYKGIRLSQVS